MAIINLEPQHQVLLDAACQLGDKLLLLDSLSTDDRNAIKSIQQALKALPKVKDGTLAMYGFSLEQGDEQSGLIRGWDVSLEYFADDPEQQGGLELFSSYLPIPETTDPNILKVKKQKEVYFHWPIGHACSDIPADRAQQWMAELQQTFTSESGAERLRIEIVYQDYYSEIEIAV